MIRFKKTLLTGATGFVGSNLLKRLLKDNWDVSIIVRPQSNLNIIEDYLGYVHLYEHDGSTKNLINIVEHTKPDIVYHLSSLFLAQHESDDIEKLIQSNILFGTQLIEALVKNKIYNFVNTGTSWQHYNNEPYNPVCLYAATKQAFEDILKYYIETTPLKVITLKLYDTYGPDDSRKKLFYLLRKTANEQHPLDMSPGEQLIDLVYIDDVIDAYMVATNLFNSSDMLNKEEYAVSSGNLIKLKDLVQIYSEIIQKDIPINWGGRPYRNREMMIPWVTGKKLPKWFPKVNIQDGIRRMENIIKR